MVVQGKDEKWMSCEGWAAAQNSSKRAVSGWNHILVHYLYHWSSTKFSSTWYDTLSVLVAKGRAKVSVAASEADWSKRICEMQYADYEDHTVGS